MIYVVSGFMRSGTSMMMQIIQETGKVPVVVNQNREGLNSQDGSYRVNPGGMFEPSYADSEIFDKQWPRKYEGKAVKIPSLYTKQLAVHEYAVIVMRRDSEEIRQSYRAAFPDAKPISRQFIDETVAECHEQLLNRKDVLCVDELLYENVVSSPFEAIAGLSPAWEGVISPEMADKVVYPEFYRFKRSKLVVGL